MSEAWHDSVVTAHERTQSGEGGASGEANEVRLKRRIGEDLAEPLKPDEDDWLEADLEEVSEWGPREDGSEWR